MHDNRNTRRVLRNRAATTWRPTQPACGPQPRTRPATCKCTVLNTKPFAARVHAAMRSYSLPAACCVPASILRLCCCQTRKRITKAGAVQQTQALHCGCVCPALRLRVLAPGARENNTSAASQPRPLGTHIEQDHLSHDPCWVQWDECCVAQPSQPLWTVIQEGGGIPGVPYRLHTQNSRSRQDAARRC
jgi:hypothetical protein